jgi:hypothetical protein
MSNINLIYVHIGNELPECFIDNIYQTLLINTNQITIYILLNDILINNVKEKISKLNTIYFKNPQFNIIYVRNSLIETYLQNNDSYNNYLKSLEKFERNLKEFRHNFWVSTTKRFYYLLATMELFFLNDVFHIENDVILYENLINIYQSLNEKNFVNNLVFVKDSDHRVVPSIIFIPNTIEINSLVSFITDSLQNSNVFYNDMTLLGAYPNYKTFNITPDKNSKYIYDGAAIGQYLDGIDIKNYNNLPPIESDDYKILKFKNPTRGFINETSVYKPNISHFYKKLYYIDNINIPLNITVADTIINNNTVPNTVPNTIQNIVTNIVPNVHIHSKQLYKFSSVFDLSYDDIISGDKIVGLCDFVISVNSINDFHKNIENFIQIHKIILIKNFNNINYNALNKIFKQSGKKELKLFIYTHLLEILVKVDFFKHLDNNIEYTLYIHNSDHTFDDTYNELLKYDYIKMVYTQNINISSPKVKLLPIGLANSMWPHGNMVEFYDIVRSTYLHEKQNNIYININPSTYSYRKIVLDKLIECNWTLSKGKPYKEYLHELSSHYFCLCIRGNGIDTHRFWESLYLGVIPVIINNETTNCQHFVDILNKLEIPFYEIKNLDFFETHSNEFFNKQLYTKMIIKLKNSIQNLKSLKLSFYNN